MEPESTFPSRLRDLRTLAELESRELDRLAGRSEGHVSMIETGRRPNPELKTARALADVLGCSIGWLLAGEGEAPGLAEVQAAVARARSAARPVGADHTAGRIAMCAIGNAISAVSAAGDPDDYSAEAAAQVSRCVKRGIAMLQVFDARLGQRAVTGGHAPARGAS